MIPETSLHYIHLFILSTRSLVYVSFSDNALKGIFRDNLPISLLILDNSVFARFYTGPTKVTIPIMNSLSWQYFSL